MAVLQRYVGFLGATLLWAAFLVCGGCHSTLVPAFEIGTARDPLRSLSLHVDVEFTSKERELLLTAAREIRRQSGGQLVVTLSYDLDFSDRDRLPPIDEWYVTRLSSTQAMTVSGDIQVVYGLTYTQRREVILVYDRLGSDSQFVHTAMHEMLHAFGVSPAETDQHVPGGAIMLGHSDWEQRDAPLCMNRLDALAISKELALDPTAFSLACSTKLR